jgi:hypothetical protein
MVGGDPMAPLIRVLFAKRLVAVSCPPIWHFAELISGSAARTLMVSPTVGKIIAIVKFHHSRGLYDLYLGLHPYLQNGGRSSLEIKVELHERAVPPSTLLTLYQYCFPRHLLSVSSFLHHLALTFCRSNGREFDEDCVSEDIPRLWRFVKFTCPTLT